MSDIPACRPTAELCCIGPISVSRENADLKWRLGGCGHEGLVVRACRRPGSSFAGWRSLRWDRVALSPASCSTVRKQVHEEELSVGDRALRLALGLWGRLVLSPPLLIPIPPEPRDGASRTAQPLAGVVSSP